MAIKAVIFDIGGVIVDADLERYASMAARLFQGQEADVRLAVQQRLAGLETGKIDSATFWKEVGESLWSQGKGKPAEVTQTQGLWRRVLADTMKINLQMLNLCWSLHRKGVIVAALSNTIREHAEHLVQVGAYQPFHPCVLSCEVGLRKPDKAIYQLTAKKAGKATKECLFVDDSLANVEGARAAGMAVHHFTGLQPLIQELGKHKLFG